MTAARDFIADQLKAHLPADYVVHAYAPQLDGVQGPVVLLQLSTIEPRPQAGQHKRVYNAKLLAVAPVADVDLATSEEVDALAEDVLLALDLSANVTWSTAQRASVDDTWAGWEITIATVPVTLTA